MAMHRFHKASLASLMAAAASGISGVALATDATFLGTPSASGSGNEATVYDSEYAAEQRLNGTFGNTPESDARPGEYFFMLGANAFRKKDYAFAIQMYEAAASWAFKPAEYNLGVIYARGQGVAVDLPRAMAWMALAAERNETRYVDAREAVYAELAPGQFDQANVIWRDLKTTYGDQVALRRAKVRWAEVRSKMTGSRVGAASNLQVGGAGGDTGDPSNNPRLAAALDAKREHGESRGFDKIVQNIKGEKTNTGGATGASDLTGGEAVDGSIAYRQLRETNNPYDPKFALGRATVGPLKQVQKNQADENAAVKQDAKKDDQQQ